MTCCSHPFLLVYVRVILHVMCTNWVKLCTIEQSLSNTLILFPYNGGEFDQLVHDLTEINSATDENEVVKVDRHDAGLARTAPSLSTFFHLVAAYRAPHWTKLFFALPLDFVFGIPLRWTSFRFQMRNQDTYVLFSSHRLSPEFMILFDVLQPFRNHGNRVCGLVRSETCKQTRFHRVRVKSGCAF